MIFFLFYIQNSKYVSELTYNQNKDGTGIVYLKRTNQVKFNPDKTHLLVFNKTTSEEDVIYLCGETAWSTATLRILNTLKKEKKVLFGVKNK